MTETQTTEVQSLKCVGTRELAGKCLHGMQPTWCAVCSPTFLNDKPVQSVDLLNDGCVICGDEIIQGFGRPRIYCIECSKNDHGARNRVQAITGQLRLFNTERAVRHLNAFRYIGFDGRYEGPTNLCFTVVSSLRKDHGYHAAPSGEHCKPLEVKFNVVTVEDSDWAERKHLLGCNGFPCVCGRSRSGLPSRSLLNPETNFCPNCKVEREEVVLSVKREYWIEKGRITHQDSVVSNKIKKITRGKYVLQGHICGQ